MIGNLILRNWRKNAPWKDMEQVEQDLIISRALVSLYSDDDLSKTLVFRWGTALNKLFLPKPARYSEDIDLTQMIPGPIGETVTRIRKALDWLGTPKTKSTERSFKLIFSFMTVTGGKGKLKIEINTTEHFHVKPLQFRAHHIKNPWFSGSAIIHTYDFNEMMASKLKALYSRRKGRDLFDIWLVLQNQMVDVTQVLELFQVYCETCEGTKVTRAELEKNLFEKHGHGEFSQDMRPLLAVDQEWSFEGAFQFVQENLIQNIPGDPWKKTNKEG